ncbi:MAG: class I SAM-dependent methyltransferase [Acidobacteria bacterium]|nr:class I SAM-dependent methyltransferase [Acidobacteriota bacterium]
MDLSVFDTIESQSSEEDKKSFLACQAAVRELTGDYNYLEIGSYLGGSIQPHLLDTKCRTIISIDKRPKTQPDERGFDWTYLENSTDRMIENLKRVAPEYVEKIKTIDGSTDEIDPSTIEEKIDLCLIDGEHTDAAMRRDFEFCLSVLNRRGGVILFHDAQITYNGIYEALEDLQSMGVHFHAYNLPHVVFAVEIGDASIHKNPLILERLVNNHVGYLYSLRDNDRYRRFANRPPFRFARTIISKLRGSNTSK